MCVRVLKRRLMVPPTNEYVSQRFWYVSLKGHARFWFVFFLERHCSCSFLVSKFETRYDYKKIVLSVDPEPSPDHHFFRSGHVVSSLFQKELCPNWEDDKAVLEWATKERSSLKTRLEVISRYVCMNCLLLGRTKSCETTEHHVISELSGTRVLSGHRSCV